MSRTLKGIDSTSTPLCKREKSSTCTAIGKHISFCAQCLVTATQDERSGGRGKEGRTCSMSLDRSSPLLLIWERCSTCRLRRKKCQDLEEKVSPGGLLRLRRKSEGNLKVLTHPGRHSSLAP